MKKFLTAALIVAVSAYASAQDLTIKGTKPITKDLTPQQVVDSLSKRFPNAQAVKYFQATPEMAAKGWNITTEDNMGESTPEYYTISFKQEGLQYYGLYDPNGTLLQCKIEQKETQLPEAVIASLKAIKKDYPGYKVVSKSYYKQQNYSKTKEYYEVTASDGKETKVFYYSADGTLQKIK
jgi:hypothetical protein